MNQQVIATLAERTVPVLPVIQVEQAEEILPIAEALAQGGINALEITLRTAAGLDAIRLAKQQLPDAIICAGTVTTVEQFKAVADLGVEFVVTPGLTESLLRVADSLDVPLLPGVATPSDIMLGIENGLNYFKLFPAAVVGGIPMLKAMQGPFPDLHFCPTGGLTADNFCDYLSLNNVFCVGGSWMIVKDGEVLQYDKTINAAKAVHNLLASNK